MKRAIELNGIANITMLIDCEVDKTEDGRYIINQGTISSIKEQLVLLERYMLAHQRALVENTEAPFWHEVRANPELYPRNGK